ncbi:hypothetical protein LTR27_012572 [Elasticomyces elasticus]|nr:hypothetical protein LTR27_012572 [Elasticomyces elasticus]
MSEYKPTDAVANQVEPVIPATTTATTTHQPEVSPVESAAPLAETAPVVNGEPAVETQEQVVAPVEEKMADTTPTVPEKAAERSIEPISEGQLAVKGPGLIKQIVPSKKEFWLSDAPVTPQHMDLYMRGEKPETSNAVVAWASQTGKGLLFFNKKGETERTRPHSVLPLYDAADLKKSHPHEITFRLHGEQHTLKATSDAERDGWFISLERAVEVGKAEKETIRASEGYKTEMEKLNKPNLSHGAGVAAGGAAAAVRSKSHAKSTDEPRRAGSDPEDGTTKHKSRSASRGMLGKLTGKKDEVEAKREVKKEEKHEEKEEKKIEKEEAKIEKEAEKHGETAPVVGSVPVVGGSTFDAPSTAERVLGAPVEEPVAESATPVNGATPMITGDKPKASKRGSIFGRVQSGLGSMMSPTKEKNLKDAELKPQVPPKDAGVSEVAPQIPEPVHEPIIDPVVADHKPLETAEPTVLTNGKSAEAAKETLDPLTPKTEKKGGFLSGLLAKRERSVSPSANMKDAPLKHEETPAVPSKQNDLATAEGMVGGAAIGEPTISHAIDEPVAPVHDTPAAGLDAEKPIVKSEEPIVPATATDATSPTANKRQSVLGNFGNLGRRASKAFGGMKTPKKESSNPLAATEPKTEQSKDIVPDVLEKPIVNGESKHTAAASEQPETVGEASPDTIHNIGQAQTTPTVAASA